MKNYTFELEDFSKLGKLIEKFNEIDNLYKKLFNLELSGKKNVKEYINTLENLKNKINESIIIIENLNFSVDLYICLCDYLFEREKSSLIYISDIESILNQNYNSRTTRRICSIFEDKILLSEKYYEKIFDKELENSLSKKTVLENILRNLKIKKAIDEDILSCFLMFVNEMTTKHNYQKYNSNILNTKYNVSFIKPSLETKLIDKKFSISHEVYTNSKVVSDLMNCDTKTYDDLKNNFLIKNISVYIGSLLGKKDFNELNDHDKFSCILYQTLIRSYLVLMDNDVIYYLKSYISNIMNSNINFNNKKLINECFDDVNNDKQKVKFISFKI